MLAYYRGAGKHGAYMLLDKMIDDCDDGAFREGMMRMVTTITPMRPMPTTIMRTTITATAMITSRMRARFPC